MHDVDRIVHSIEDVISCDFGLNDPPIRAFSALRMIRIDEMKTRPSHFSEPVIIEAARLHGALLLGLLSIDPAMGGIVLRHGSAAVPLVISNIRLFIPHQLVWVRRFSFIKSGANAYLECDAASIVGLTTHLPTAPWASLLAKNVTVPFHCNIIDVSRNVVASMIGRTKAKSVAELTSEMESGKGAQSNINIESTLMPSRVLRPRIHHVDESHHLPGSVLCYCTFVNEL